MLDEQASGSRLKEEEEVLRAQWQEVGFGLLRSLGHLTLLYFVRCVGTMTMKIKTSVHLLRIKYNYYLAGGLPRFNFVG